MNMASFESDSDSSGSYDSDPEERGLESKEDDDEVDHLKKELSEIPFCELQDLRDKVGSKKYNHAIHGVLEKRENSSQKPDKNKNKNKPMEISSKQKVPKLRKVISAKRKKGRDPRFDDLSGKFNEELFNKAYSFVDEIKAKEKQDIERQFTKTKNLKRKETLQKLLKGMEQNEKLSKAKQKRLEEKRARKKAEMELVKKGKKPFYLKKSEQKKLELADKYKQLKSSGKLQKYLKKREKKIASKDRKHIPQRREASSS